MLAAVQNSPVAPLPTVLPPSSALPTPGPAPILSAPGVYSNPSLIPTSPPQFMMTNGCYGDLHSDFAPTSSVLSVITNPVYFMPGGKVANGNTIPGQLDVIEHTYYFLLLLPFYLQFTVITMIIIVIVIIIIVIIITVNHLFIIVIAIGSTMKPNFPMVSPDSLDLLHSRT